MGVGRGLASDAAASFFCRCCLSLKLGGTGERGSHRPQPFPLCLSVSVFVWGGGGAALAEPLDTVTVKINISILPTCKLPSSAYETQVSEVSEGWEEFKLGTFQRRRGFAWNRFTAGRKNLIWRSLPPLPLPFVLPRLLLPSPRCSQDSNNSATNFNTQMLSSTHTHTYTEFHYRSTSLTAGGRQVCVIQPPPSSPLTLFLSIFAYILSASSLPLPLCLSPALLFSQAAGGLGDKLAPDWAKCAYC